MTPALRSRLEAERMFTVANMVTAYATGAIDALKRQENPEAFEAETLARVQAHLSSDTTRIRPKRQA